MKFSRSALRRRFFCALIPLRRTIKIKNKKKDFINGCAALCVAAKRPCVKAAQEGRTSPTYNSALSCPLRFAVSGAMKPPLSPVLRGFARGRGCFCAFSTVPSKRDGKSPANRSYLSRCAAADLLFSAEKRLEQHSLYGRSAKNVAPEVFRISTPSSTLPVMFTRGFFYGSAKKPSGTLLRPIFYIYRRTKCLFGIL